MSSRNMCLLPRATLHRDREQALLQWFRHYWQSCCKFVRRRESYLATLWKISFKLLQGIGNLLRNSKEGDANLRKLQIFLTVPRGCLLTSRDISMNATEELKIFIEIQEARLVLIITRGSSAPCVLTRQLWAHLNLVSHPFKLTLSVSALSLFCACWSFPLSPLSLFRYPSISFSPIFLL